jgi:hypothetical protein
VSTAAIVTLVVAVVVLGGGLLTSLVVGTRASRRDRDAGPR